MSRSLFWADQRIIALAAALRALPDWAETTRYIEAGIRFHCDDGAAHFKLSGGETKIVLAADEIAGVTVTASTADWERVASGQIDWFQAATSGAISVMGDTVFVLRNVKIFWLAFKALAMSANAPTAQGPYSPPFFKRGEPTIGHYIEVAGGDVYYEEAGSGPAILCLHAACQDTLMYRHVLAGLSDEFRVIAVDAPGHGKSQMPQAGPLRDIAALAVFHEQVIDRLALDRPVIVGCSMAGNAVLALAARLPAGYAAVISAEGADFTPGLDRLTLDMMLLNGQQRLECYAQSLTGKRTPPGRAADVIRQIRRALPEVMQADLGAYSGFDMRDDMADITASVLLIRGTDDWLVSDEQVTATASRIANSRVALLEGTGHYPMIENPVEFNDAVRRFLHNLGIKGG